MSGWVVSWGVDNVPLGDVQVDNVWVLMSVRRGGG